MRISKSAAPAARGQPALAIFGKVVKQIARQRFKNLRSNRHTDDHVRALVSGAVAALGMRTAPGRVLGVITQMQERVQRFVSLEKHVATAAAVAARRTAARHKLFATKSGDTV